MHYPPSENYEEASWGEVAAAFVFMLAIGLWFGLKKVFKLLTLGFLVIAVFIFFSPLPQAQATTVIAYVNSAQFAAAAGTATKTLQLPSCSTDNALIVVGVFTNGNSGLESVTGIQINGVNNMTEAISQKNGFGTQHTDLWYYLGATTSNQQIIVSYSPSVESTIQAACYSGALQTSQPDASTNNTGPVGSTATYTVSLTTVTDNDWIINYVTYAGAGTQSASTNEAQRLSEGVEGMGFYDTNAAQTPAGSKSMTTTASSATANWASLLVGFKPNAAAAAGAVKPPLIISWLGWW